MLCKEQRRYLAMAVVVALAIPLLAGSSLGCAAIGKKQATAEQKFYEADAKALLALELTNRVIVEVGPEKIPEKLKVSLLDTAKGLRALRKEARMWMAECSPRDGCALEKKLELATRSMLEMAALVMEIVNDVQALKEADNG